MSKTREKLTAMDEDIATGSFSSSMTPTISAFKRMVVVVAGMEEGATQERRKRANAVLRLHPTHRSI
jgi:hypothetical protein